MEVTMNEHDISWKIAVLIDAENAQYSVMGAVLSELSKHGRLVVKKAYGDWSSSHLKNWKQPLNELAITPEQQFAYTQGKNSSDAAMIIDAMDLLYSRRFDAFALVTSDSDFTTLALRLREEQIHVFGVGEEKTPVAFRNACDDFISTEILRALDAEKEDAPRKGAAATGKKKTPVQLRRDTKLVNILRNAATEYADEDGWTPLGPCGSLIKRQYPDFDSRSYGYQTLSQLFEASGLFEIERRQNPGNKSTHTIYVKIKKTK
jgi:uncharacterized LabA/DUF88 family protein